MNSLELAATLGRPYSDIREALIQIRYERYHGTRRYPVKDSVLMCWDDKNGKERSQTISFGIPIGTALAVCDYLGIRLNPFSNFNFTFDFYDCSANWSGLDPNRDRWDQVKVKGDWLAIKDPSAIPKR
jgi:hypothetical protein